MVLPDDPGAAYLRDHDRVISIELGGERVAVPLNIMWWHEIVNMRIGGHEVAVTHCPLTGSSMVFDRSEFGGVEFGVSGLLYQNNLIMYDRSEPESLWPQMSAAAVCGPSKDMQLSLLPATEMRWKTWRQIYPEARVVSSETGFLMNYQFYGYGRYDEIDNPSVFVTPEGGLDPRRPPKERVLGIRRSLDGGLAFPFGELAKAGDVVVAETEAGNAVVFWDAEAQSAMAYVTRLQDGLQLSFRSDGERILDEQTGSVWRFDGLAIAGPLRSRRLVPVAEAYVSYWFAWAVFQPETTIWLSFLAR